MSTTRDLTQAQFDAACKRRGFISSGFMGYYDVGHNTSVSVLNAGHNRRAQLAYLIAQAKKAEKSFLKRQADYEQKVSVTK